MGLDLTFRRPICGSPEALAVAATLPTSTRRAAQQVIVRTRPYHDAEVHLADRLTRT